MDTINDDLDVNLSSGNKTRRRRKYFARLMYDAIIDSDDSNESRELAIETLASALERFVKDVIAEERNRMLLEIKREVMRNIEEYKNKNTDAGEKIFNPSFVVDILQKINETKNLAQSSQVITKDTNEKSEMIIEQLEKFENMLNEKMKVIEGLIEHLKKSENLTTTDKQILNFIKDKGVVCADDVQSAFKYKGKNAASARLNILYRKNKLEKIINDRKVYYRILDEKLENKFG